MFSHSKTHILDVTFSVSVHKKKHPVGQKTKKTSFSKICVFFILKLSHLTQTFRDMIFCVFLPILDKKHKLVHFLFVKRPSQNVSNPENALTQPVNFTQTTPHGEVLRLLCALALLGAMPKADRKKPVLGKKQNMLQC